MSRSGRPCFWTFAAAVAVLTAMAAAPAVFKAAAQQQAPPRPNIPTIRTTTTLVEVPVLVLDKSGQPMDILGESDFSVYDDNLPQKLVSFDNTPRPLSLAIVVDTNDWDAIDQAHRSAQLITDMVVGAAGEASIYTPGPEPRQIVPFTSDANKLVNALRHLTKAPVAPQGGGSILEPLNLAMLSLRHEPQSRTRAALIISKDSAKSGLGAQALIEGDMSDAMPIFRIAPNRPANAQAHVNPDTPEERGVGQGSQRVIAPPAPVDSRGQPTSSAGNANLNLGPLFGAAATLTGHIFEPHNLDFVYYSGGLTYNPSNDSEFDRKLSLIGDELRAIYHLYYSPSDLTAQAALHVITVKLDIPATASVGSTTYRRTYVGAKLH
ncbi:MAG TPA: VWA domain-containing protein [Terriglobales bacterium]|jgi:VWFA-related protein